MAFHVSYNGAAINTSIRTGLPKSAVAPQLKRWTVLL